MTSGNVRPEGGILGGDLGEGAKLGIEGDLCGVHEVKNVEMNVVGKGGEGEVWRGSATP